MQLKTLNVPAISHKTVLVRVDFNVPLSPDGQIEDDTRIVNSLQTIKFLLENQAKVVLIAHLGRPDGRTNPKLSLEPIARKLSSLLRRETSTNSTVHFWQNSIETETNTLKANIEQMRTGDVALLENIRFYQGEETNNQTFSQTLASLGEIFVNDAFSVCHRAHASTVGIAQILPSYAGFSLVVEVEHLEKVLDNPQRPLVVIVGGAKITDKVAALANLAKIADSVLVGGGVANLALEKKHIEIGHSFIEEAPLNQELLKKIILPVDVVAATSQDNTETTLVDVTAENALSDTQENLMYLDIGPKTIKLFSSYIKDAGTIFWSGPLGVWEQAQFTAGTEKIAQAVAKSSAYSVVGGGDTEAALSAFGLTEKISYVSKAGSATLEFLAGNELAGLKVLQSSSM